MTLVRFILLYSLITSLHGYEYPYISLCCTQFLDFIYVLPSTR